ncbi:MAG TPA: hypothetical protein VHZ50_11430 [Puia sp.]|jgi:hypothetical protein|nr:hypothetical protein [Puia sp.]
MSEAKKRDIKNKVTRIRGKKKLNDRNGVDALKYCGVITLKEDPLIIQKRLRDEWR